VEKGAEAPAQLQATANQLDRAERYSNRRHSHSSGSSVSGKTSNNGRESSHFYFLSEVLQSLAVITLITATVTHTAAIAAPTRVASAVVIRHGDPEAFTTTSAPVSIT
jgi:hypothetical protein